MGTRGESELLVFRVRSDSVVWGGYGAILYHGLVKENKLFRAGPWIPDLFLPYGQDESRGETLYLSEKARSDLVLAGVPLSLFVESAVGRIVDIPWQDWDLQAPLPRYVPQSGEPDDYLKSTRLTRDITDDQAWKIWRLVPEREVAVVPRSVILDSGLPGVSLEMRDGTKCGDFVLGRVEYPRYRADRVLIVNRNGKNLLETFDCSWLKWEPVSVA